MSTTTIPAQTIKTCDCCKAVMDAKTARQEGGLVLQAHALDMHNHPCADATRRLDLCDSCLYAVGNAIDGVLLARSAVAASKL